MGDSAGGGFSLALAQAIRDKGLELPKRLVLISPWVDVLGNIIKIMMETNVFDFD